MLALLRLYLPVLFPSWRFFKEIEPSARVEYRVGSGPWSPATARPRRVGPLAMLGRLFWNPHWNETLYLVSCAERLVSEPTDHAAAEIRARVARRERVSGRLGFRLVFHDRNGRSVELRKPAR